MAQSRDVHFISRTYVRIKKLLSRVMNKQFLIFLFFVALSTVFWLFKSLGATYEMEFEVPLKLVNVPEKAVITTELPKTMRVVVKDRGAVLLQYRYVSLLSPVTVDFTQDESDDGHVVALTREYIKQVTRQFPPSAHIQARHARVLLQLRLIQARPRKAARQFQGARTLRHIRPDHRPRLRKRICLTGSARHNNGRIHDNPESGRTFGEQSA